MTVLPEHLGRALHAACGRISEADGNEPVATLADIEERMGDPPARRTLNGWLVDLEELGLVKMDLSGWRITKDGWRTVNRLATGKPGSNGAV